MGGQGTPAMQHTIQLFDPCDVQEAEGRKHWLGISQHRTVVLRKPRT